MSKGLVTLLSLGSASLFATLGSAQDVTAISWSGNVYTIDLATGAQTFEGWSSYTETNSMARHSNGDFYSVGDPNTTFFPPQLIRVNPNSGQGNAKAPMGVPNVRAMAFDQNDILFAVSNSTFGSNDGLYVVNINTGIGGLVGDIGFQEIQALTHDPDTGLFYAWDCVAGLVTIDPASASAAGTNVNGLLDGDCSQIQSLFLDGSGNLIGVRNRFYAVDKVTGAATILGGAGGFNDIRGAELTNPPAPPLTGAPSQISVSGGGAQNFVLDAGPAHGSSIYLLLGSASGTSPGFPVDGFVLPLVIDSYTLFTLNGPNTPPLANFFGTLSPMGKGTARIAFAPGAAPAALVGQTLNHAYLTIEISALPTVSFTSPAVPLGFVP